MTILSNNTFTKLIITLILSVSAFSPIVAQANDQTTQTIVKRIDKAKQELQSTEKKIAKESRKLSQRLNDVQQEVSALREKAAQAQRLKDEQLLSLESIKNRLEKWETQSLYQKHLVRSFIDSSSSQNSPPNIEGDSSSSVERALTQSVMALEEQLHPKWQQRKVVDTNGKFISPSVLTLGPTEVYYDTETQSAQTLSRDINNQLTAVEVLSSSQQKQIQDLHEHGQGNLVFDPTLGSALKLSQSNAGLVEHVSKGGIWAIPIVFFGALSLVFATLKAWHLWRLPAIDPQLINSIRREPQKDQSTSIKAKEDDVTLGEEVDNPAQKELINIAKSYPVSSHRDELLLAFLLEHKHRLDRFLGVIATSASVAPLLGLLGTVSGMISTFKLMTIFGSGDASTVSGGISEALVTTELGLIVAIPSLVVSALLARRSKSYNHKLESFAIKLSKLDFD